LSGVFGEDGVQSHDEEIGVGLRENQWRAELDHVVMRAVGAGEDAAFAQTIDDVRSLIGRRFASLTIEHKVDTEK